MTATKLDWALHHAGKGLRIFPVQSNSKIPIHKNWPDIATADPAQLSAWWHEWPDANIGAVPGASGHVVIDIDTKKVDGYASLKKLEAEYGDLPVSMRTETPTGGEHVWLRLENSCKNSAGSLADGIDTRGVRGYVLMGGSTIDGVEYQTDDNPIDETPDGWHAPLYALGARDERREAVEGIEVDHPGNIDRAKDYVTSLIDSDDVAVAFQGGNTRTFQLAGMLRDLGLSCDAALDAAEPWNDACRPPWSPSELETIFYNAYEYAQNELGAKALVDPSGASFASIKAPPDPHAGSASGQGDRPRRFYPLTIDEMVDLPDPSWLIPNILPNYELSMMFGAYGSYKSFAALDMALSVAAGVPCLGADHDQEAHPAIYIAGEGQIGLAKQRVPAWLNFHNIKSSIPFRMIRETPIVDHGHGELSEIFSVIEETCGEALPRLIVIDTHARSMLGLDENTVQDTSKAVNFYEQIIRRYSAAGLIIHHSGIDAARERGSTSLGASMASVYKMEYDAPSRMITLSCKKMKDAEEIKPIHLQATRADTSIVLIRKEWTEPKAEFAYSELYYDVISVLKEHGAHSLGAAITTTTLAASLPTVLDEETPALQEASKRKMAASLTRAAKDELITLVEKDMNPPQWRLPRP